MPVSRKPSHVRDDIDWRRIINSLLGATDHDKTVDVVLEWGIGLNHLGAQPSKAVE